MRKYFYFTLTAILFSFISSAQELKISFKAINSKNEGIAATSFKITLREDSLNVIQKVADNNGVASFTLLQNKQYIVEVSAVNYNSAQKGITITPGKTTFVFALTDAAKTLAEVKVTSSKPLMKQEDDKTVVDPENLAASSTNAYEIIEKTPGLFTDQDGNVYLNTTTPATIYINGREMKMSAADIATMLKSLPPNAIAKIEILRTPSAKYDASGGGGIINIVLKKGVKIGLTGTVTAGMNQGKYGSQFGGLNINNNKDGRNFYVNLNYNHRNTYDQIQTNRQLTGDSLLSQDAYTTYPSNTYFGNYGWSKDLNKKWDVSFDGRASVNIFDNNTLNQSNIYKTSTSQTISSVFSAVNNNGSSFIGNQGFNSKYKIDTLGSEWTTDISYNYSKSKSDQGYLNSFTSPSPKTINGKGDIDNTRNIFTIQTDLKWKLPKKLVFEAGLKSSFLKFNSTTDYLIQSNGSWVKDDFRTNSFVYKENINAAYVQATKTIGSVVIKTGTRIENTNMNGHQLIPLDTSFKVNRTDFFPYVYISRKVMKIAGYDLKAYLVYRRTISRPVYEQLNPFPKFIDQFLYEIGNPGLRPQFTQNYEANISVDERPIFAIGQNYTKDIFTNVVYQSAANQSLAYRTYDNLGTNKEIYFRALGALPPGKKYFFVLGTQYNHSDYNGLYENKPLSFKRGSWSIFTFHQLKLDKLSQLSFHGFIRFNGTQQFYELSNFGMLNASINRQFIKKKLTITLSMSDIFFTNNNNFVLNQGSVKAYGYRESDTRRFGINLRYNFGIRKKEENNNVFSVDSPENRN
ncbi:MAG: TonB-dependent receptor [Sphingobacteriales bacterium]|nr:TonB-dependent receptor [Sphingobacteriales bacterium]MBI3719883.1 TonB-dependent receptor [Sphingobacteriales bacterium]